MPTDTNIKTTGNAWVYKIICWAFVISLVFSLVNASVMPRLPLWGGALFLFGFIVIGIFFDIIATAAAVASQTPFHSMNTRGIKGAKHALTLIRNGEKVTNFCGDVVGDVCGIMSGGALVILIDTMVKEHGFPLLYTGLLLTAVVASLTIGGKAISKSYSLRNGNQIIYQTALFICLFKGEQ